MDLDGMVKRSESKNPTTHASTMAATISSNYWTATAFSAMLQQQQQQPEEDTTNKYTHDDCGVECFVTADAPNDFVPCEPHCANCGYPPHICDPFYTRCVAYNPAPWFSKEQGEWIDPKPTTTTTTTTTTIMTPAEQEEERWNQHKYGLCPICKTGLDDRADFTLNYTNGAESGIMMCFDCDAKLI
jgi:hypothetical protein